MSENKISSEVVDSSEAELIKLRRKIYLTLMSSLTFEESAHKLLSLPLEKGQEIEVATMLLEANSVDKTFNKFFYLQAERLCRVRPLYAAMFEELFATYLEKSHDMDVGGIRNTALLYGRLFSSKCISWSPMRDVLLTEEATTSSTRIFLKHLLQEIAAVRGNSFLTNELKDPEGGLYGLIDRADKVNVRFACNFFAAIGLQDCVRGLRNLLAPPVKDEPEGNTHRQDHSSRDRIGNTEPKSEPLEPNRIEPKEEKVDSPRRRDSKEYRRGDGAHRQTDTRPDAELARDDAESASGDAIIKRRNYKASRDEEEYLRFKQSRNR